MKLENYYPVGTEVLFEEVREEKTASGIYVPGVDFTLEKEHNFWETKEIVYDGKTSKLSKYKVIKVGEACTAIKPGDNIILRTGSRPEDIELDDTIYKQIMSAYIIGYERET